MEAVRQVHKVHNHSFTVQLPAEFRADEVEVIVLPVQAERSRLQNLDGETRLAIEKFLALDTSHFSGEQLAAYQKNRARLQEWLETGQGALVGIFEELIEIAEDFAGSEEIDALFYADNIEPA